MSWPAILVLAAGAYLAKAAGLLLLGPRAATGTALRVAGLLPPTLLAALVIVQSVGGERALVVDARLAGLAVAGLAVWRRAPFLVVVVAASAVTAVVRLGS